MWHPPFCKLLFFQLGFFWLISCHSDILRIKLVVDSRRRTGVCLHWFLYYVSPAKLLVPSGPRVCVFSLCMRSQMASGPWRLPVTQLWGREAVPTPLCYSCGCVFLSSLLSQLLAHRDTLLPALSHSPAGHFTTTVWSLLRLWEWKAAWDQLLASFPSSSPSFNLK